mmetsp:Transcript_8662/g.8180  ORF Transcript_8662/g.8180 Transcript_8662/m.8180 type:complete len:865 (+) Transcript_8662:635-3229(+)
MTGESIELKKGNLENCLQKLEEFNETEDAKEGPHEIPSPVLLSGTQIQTGEGWFLVIMVGKNSCVGKIMSKLNQDVEMTPLQEKLEQIANDIGLLGTYAAAITVIVLFIRFFIEQGMEGYDWGNNIGEYLEIWFRYLIVGVTIIVVAVPEGLPLAVIISLAYSVRKMLADNNFVKRLAACEIMGGANNICSDKTGTLTKNEMNVTNIWNGRDNKLNVEFQSIDPSTVFPDEKTRDLFIQSCACNTVGEIGNTNATGEAILKMLKQFDIDYNNLRETFLPDPFVRFQFTSKRKKMSTILQNIEDNESDYDKRLHVKGASEIVLKLCTHYIDENGEQVELTDELKEDIINNTITDYAKQALRTICVAYRDIEEEEGGATHEDDAEDGVNKQIEMNGLICLGILGIRDVIRPEVPDAVNICQKAGIKVRMVTGDNKVTALAIAKECNIISGENEDSVLEGPEFYERVGGLVKEDPELDSNDSNGRESKEVVKNMEEFVKIWKNLDVLARSRPEDKYLLVTGIKQMGDTVAVTGDGTNDAPALKKADVGFAMGITGTDVAKHAADIILLDDNFSSIVKACMWGRNIYANIRRFLQFQLTVNIVALISAFIGSCILRESPLKSIQLLWVNMIMDSLASLALATEPPKKELLDGPPYRRDEYIISRKMVKHILTIAIWQSIVIFTMVFAGEHFIPEDPHYELKQENGNIVPGRSYTFNGEPLYSTYLKAYGPSRHYTMVFTTFVMLQVFNMLNARKINDEKNIFAGMTDNPMFLTIWVGIFIVQVVITQFSADVFQVNRQGLTLTQWAICIGLGFSCWIVSFIAKYIPDTICPELGKKRKHIDEHQPGVMGLRRGITKKLTNRMPSMSFN